MIEKQPDSIEHALVQSGETALLKDVEEKTRWRNRPLLWKNKTDGSDLPKKETSPTKKVRKKRIKDALQKSEENQEALNAVMRSTVARHNEKEEHSLLKVPLDQKTKFDLTFLRDGIDNQLVIHIENKEKKEIKEDTVHIGHYDPALEKFLIYPELISQDEFTVIKPLALQRRKENTEIRKNFDYDSDVLKALRQKHREVLLKDSLVYKIAERCDRWPSEQGAKKIPKYTIDESTSFYICLVPKLGYARSANNEFNIDEVFVSLALQGHLFRNKSGVAQRETLHYIHLGAGYRDDPDGRYIPNRKLVTDEEFVKLTALTNELQHLKATSIPNLDTEMIALKLK